MSEILFKTATLCGRLRQMNGTWLNHQAARSYRGRRFKNVMKKNAVYDEPEEPFEFPKKRSQQPPENNSNQESDDLEKYLDFPSDVENYLSKVKENAGKEANKSADQSKKSFRPRIDPRDTSIVLFPGQGSQFVGMGKKLLPYPKVKEMYSIASSILGFDLLKICLDGPQEELSKTVNCQAATVVTSLAAVEKLKAEKPQAIEKCITTAGFSVGEISALVFSGALSFEDAITLIKVRSSAMQEASNEVAGGMMAVSITPQTNVKYACFAAEKFCKQELEMPDAVCQVTNFLHPGCKVIAGNSEALEFILRNADTFKIRKYNMLPVSGAFHTRLMKPAAKVVQRTIEKLTIKDPVIPIHSNVTSKRFKGAEDIRYLIFRQIWNPVMWEQTMHAIYARPQDEYFPETYEVGPGRQLGTILSKINRKAFEEYKSIDV